MSRTKRGSKSIGESYSARRPGNEGYFQMPSYRGNGVKNAKRATHKAERRAWKVDV